ncbi:MAG: nucleotide exchange factor GrpE [Candidatus Levybacteria bacterium]|nr:nucleotide exchange factor GrpE [Candidatus Levybacteria bacterium]
MQNDPLRREASNTKFKNEKENEEKGKSKNEIAHLKQRIEELENQIKRISADYQNLEKRTALEKREWLIKANKDLILRLLPALDFLLLSSKHLEDEGLKLSIQKFFAILKTEGVEKIETTGKEFDPSLMEGIKSVAGEENKVVEELRSGFKMGDQVLRPAQVAVGSSEQNEKEIN